MSPWHVQLERVRRRWALVLVVTLAAGVAALGATLAQGTTYTASAALGVFSRNRSPDQDSVLTRGYADFFNQPSMGPYYTRRAGVPPGVTVVARAAASSPILYVDATADAPDPAVDAATRTAAVFRDEVRDSLGGDQAQALADLRVQLATATATLAGLPPTSPERTAVAGQVTLLQTRVNDLQAGTVPALQNLQVAAGVVENSPPLARTVLAALVGGLMLGGLAAVGLGRWENRVGVAAELPDRLGLATLATIGGPAEPPEPTAEAAAWPSMAAVVDLVDLAGARTVTVTAPRAGRGASTVAAALAAAAARQGRAALLVLADASAPPVGLGLENRPGTADVLSPGRAAELEGLVLSDRHGLAIVPPGAVAADAWRLAARPRVDELLRRATELADLVVIAAPPVLGTAGGACFAGCADRTVLAVERHRTRVPDVREAVGRLERADAVTLGAVLIDGADTLDVRRLLGDPQWIAAPESLAPRRTEPPAAVPGGVDGFTSARAPS